MKWLSLVLAISACTFNRGEKPASDASVDAAIVIDASTSARSQREIVSGAGRAATGTITIDVEVGHGISVHKSTAGGTSIEGAPVVKP